MSKSVLVIDTPTRCEECEVFNPYEGCPLTGSLGGIDDDCPLRQLPEKKNFDDIYRIRRFNADERIGWNACLDEITGDTK